ncbi:MAG: sugar ABC transporter permease [Spirochaetota bacterium]
MQIGKSYFSSLSISPTILVMFLLVAGPIGYSLFISFHQWNLMQPAFIGTFTGLRNYIEAIEDAIFWKSLKVTILYVFFTLSLELTLGLIIALMLNTLGKFRSVLLGLLIIPWAIPNVVNGLMWKWILNPHYGALNGILYSLGIIKDYISLLSHPVLAMGAVVNAHIWKQLPLVVFILLAGLQSIPEEVFEAGTVDGANAAQKLQYIILPYLRAPIAVLLILQTMEALRTFDIIWIITGGGPGTATSVIAWLTYNAAFREFDFGQGAALSFVITILTLGFSFLYIRLLRTNE